MRPLKAKNPKGISGTKRGIEKSETLIQQKSERVELWE